MSNHLAIATVTASLAKRIEDVMGQALGAQNPVTTEVPKFDDLAALHANVYLFQVTPNVAFRNGDLPTRRGDGSAVQRPCAALDLHYLLSFSGANLDAQIALGAAVASLHAKPWLTDDDLKRATDAPNSPVKGSDLALQAERVKLTPSSLTLDELSKLWSVFLQATYVLSVVYQASLVLVESDLDVQPPLPVRQPGVWPAPTKGPRLDEAVNADGRERPITAESTLLLRGERLASDHTQVRFDSNVGVDVSARSETVISVDLSAVAGLRAGAHGVKVVHRVRLNGELKDHPAVGTESNALAFLLRPTPAGLPGPASAAGGDVKLKLSPRVGPGQSVLLHLNHSDPAVAASRSVRAKPITAEADTVTFPLPALAAGKYLVRVSVDGADSVLETDAASGAYTGPILEVKP